MYKHFQFNHQLSTNIASMANNNFNVFQINQPIRYKNKPQESSNNNNKSVLPGQLAPTARMARQKCCTSIAQAVEPKTSSVYVDPGATHNFFNTKVVFIAYTQIAPEVVESASSTSSIIGKGTVEIPIDGCVVVQAYHAPYVL